MLNETQTGGSQMINKADKNVQPTIDIAVSQCLYVKHICLGMSDGQITYLLVTFPSLIGHMIFCRTGHVAIYGHMDYAKVTKSTILSSLNYF